MGEVWRAGSTVELCFVPWDSGYNRVVQFADAQAQADWFASQSAGAPRLTIGGNTYVRPNTPLVVDGPYSQIHRYNYCVVENPVQPVDNSEAERLFYFITSAEYVSPGSTRIALQLDVWQTRVVHDGATFGAAYCERGHVAVAAAALARQSYGFCTYARRYLTVPEGLDIGSDYQTDIDDYIDLGSDAWCLVLSTTDLSADPGDVSNPHLVSAYGGPIDGLVSGAAEYLLTDSTDMLKLLSAAKEYPWVVQGIIGIYVVPSECFDIDPSAQKVQILGSVSAYDNASISAHAGGSQVVKILPDPQYADPLADVYDKLRAYPYMAVELFSTSNGQSTLYKPEGFTGAQMRFQLYACVLAPFARLVVAPQNYAGGDEPESRTIDTPTLSYSSREMVAYGGEWLSSQCNVSDFPQLPLVTDGYLQYMAGTAHSRQYSYQAAGWSLASSQATARNSYENQRRSMATAAANQGVQNSLTDTQQGLSALGSAAGILGSLLGGNIGGAASGAFSAGLNYLGTEAGQQASNQTFANNQALAGATADANQRLAEYVNQGNYQNTISGINATVQDAQLTPPSQVGMYGGDGFALANAQFAFLIRRKRLRPQQLSVVLSYFAKYGYAVHEWVQVPDDLCIMQQTSYWRMEDVPVTCATANDTEVLAIKGIFAQGVSVYDDPAKLDDAGLMRNYVRTYENYYLNKGMM